MYYEMNRIIDEEISGIDCLLDALNKVECGEMKGYLELRSA